MIYTLILLACIACLILGFIIGYRISFRRHSGYISLVRMGKLIRKQKEYNYPLRLIMVGLSYDSALKKYRIVVEYNVSYSNPRVWFFPI